MRKQTTGSYDPDKTVILSIWHNRLLFCALPFSREYCQRTNAIASPSRDGQYIADIMHKLGLKTIRGSSKKSGARALLAAIKVVKNGSNVSLTPDGPRGPKYCFSSGAILLASKTGAPILPYSINSKKYWELKSWDNFQIPKPFSKMEIIYGEPIHIPTVLNEEQFEEYRLKVEQANNALTVD